MAAKKAHINYVFKVILAESVASVVLGIVLCYLAVHFQWEMKLNFEALISALVNLDAGIIIAIFLAVFNSANKNVESFKKFVKATKQIYMLFLINCAVTCIVSLFVTNTDQGLVTVLLRDQQSMNIVFSVVALVFTLYNLYLVFKMLSITFRDLRTES